MTSAQTRTLKYEELELTPRMVSAGVEELLEKFHIGCDPTELIEGVFWSMMAASAQLQSR